MENSGKLSNWTFSTHRLLFYVRCEQLAFFYNLGKDKKFTNQWKYFDYDIVEKVKNTTAEVVFKSKDSQNDLQEIVYKLELRKDNWIVSDIYYKKK